MGDLESNRLINTESALHRNSKLDFHQSSSYSKNNSGYTLTTSVGSPLNVLVGLKPFQSRNYSVDF